MNYGDEMKNKGRILKIIIAAVAVVCALSAAVFLYSREKKYDFTEKSFISMDTVITEKIYGEGSSVHIAPVFSIVTGLDEAINRFNEESELYRLNTEGKTTDKSVIEIIKSVKQISDDVGGAFDITVGDLSDLWSIGKDGERVPTEKEIKAVLKDIGYGEIRVENGTVYHEGGEIDLGAVGKGFACDLIKAYLSSVGAEGAVVSVGGSILAYGDYNKKGDEWSIAIRHPRNENEFLGIIRLDEGFVSTSGDYERYFEKDGKRYHHIFDARTGMPADSGLVSVTVVTESGILSDALSTACFIVGPEEGKRLIEKYGASAIFVDEEMNVTTVGEISFEKQ
ncbi:MAG: FAD:protein FMN transferase [Ruminococcaceae bacterium]|nr:FAD:protein FMN transferase [Oscillospiraceae bacterium]